MERIGLKRLTANDLDRRLAVESVFVLDHGLSRCCSVVDAERVRFEIALRSASNGLEQMGTLFLTRELLLAARDNASTDIRADILARLSLDPPAALTDRAMLDMAVLEALIVLEDLTMLEDPAVLEDLAVLKNLAEVDGLEVLANRADEDSVDIR